MTPCKDVRTSTAETHLRASMSHVGGVSERAPLLNVEHPLRGQVRRVHQVVNKVVDSSAVLVASRQVIQQDLRQNIKKYYLRT